MNRFVHLKADTYELLEGGYKAIAAPLFDEKNRLNSEMLLLWLPDLQRYSSYDREHTNLVIFSSATWSDIVANPLPYFNSILAEPQDIEATRAIMAKHAEYPMNSVMNWNFPQLSENPGEHIDNEAL